jgi:hypothetical protein
VSLAVGQAPAGGAAVPLHSNLSHTVHPKKGGAEWSGGRGGLIASREGRGGGPHPTNIHTLLSQHSHTTDQHRLTRKADFLCKYQLDILIFVEVVVFNKKVMTEHSIF